MRGNPRSCAFRHSEELISTRKGSRLGAFVLYFCLSLREETQVVVRLWRESTPLMNITTCTQGTPKLLGCFVLYTIFMSTFVCDGCSRSRPSKEGGSLKSRIVENREGTWARYAHKYRLCDSCITILMKAYEGIRKENSHQT